MRISPVNNLNFGYNKKLNRRLNEKLDSTPATSTTKLIKDLNYFCNQTENDIIQLENDAYGGTARNEEQIALKLPIFMAAKRQCCLLVERIFPELDFLRTTLDTLENEEEGRYDLYDKLYDLEKEKLCYKWRDELFKILDDDLDNMTALVSTPSRSGVGVGSDESERELLQKFEAGSSSPKSLEDVVGLSEQIEDIKDLILFPLEHPQEAQQRKEDYGIEIPHFVILYGPPGCGKTMTVEALAAESGCDMYHINLADVGSSFVNGTAIKVAKAFDEAFKIAQKSDKPLLLFMDEMDSLLAQRHDATDGGKEDNKVVNTFLPLIEKSKDKNIIIVGATNMYELLDKAVKRRVKYEAYIGLPNQDEIKKLLVKQLSKIKMGQTLATDEEALERISHSLIGYSPSNIVKIISDASMLAYRAKKEIDELDISYAKQRGSYNKINEQEYLPESKKRSTKIGITY